MKLWKWAAITIMLSKEYGQTNTFMSIMLMTQITLDMWMWGPFHTKSGVNVCWENGWTNVQMYIILQQNNLFLSQNKTQSKRKRPKVLIALGGFVYKVWIIVHYGSQNFFGDNWDLGTIFSVVWKLLFLQTFIPTMKNRTSA